MCFDVAPGEHLIQSQGIARQSTTPKISDLGPARFCYLSRCLCCAEVPNSVVAHRQLVLHPGHRGGCPTCLLNDVCSLECVDGFKGMTQSLLAYSQRP